MFMDRLDKKLYNDLNTQIEIPNELDKVIKNGLNKNKANYKLLKIIASACTVLAVASGMVYAGNKIYEKIWREPEKITGYSTNYTNNESISKENIMSEDEARKKAKDILEKFGYGSDEITEIELQSNPANYDLSWYIKTEKNIEISFDANGEGSFSISNDNLLYNDIKNYRTTEKEAKETARKICKKYGYDSEQYSYIKVSSNSGSESESYRWSVDFYKEYDGLKNPYESIHIGFIPQINEVVYFGVVDKKFENNPVEITEEKAKEIALSEEQKISTKYEIKNIQTKLRIDSMNGDAYLRTNDYEQLNEQTSSANYPSEKHVFYRTDSRIRRGWVVTIIYNIPDDVNKFDGNYNVNDEKFSYFIDATTGEVIGGGSIF